MSTQRKEERLVHEMEVIHQPPGAGDAVVFPILAAGFGFLIGWGLFAHDAGAGWWRLPLAAGVGGGFLLTWRLLARDFLSIKKLIFHKYEPLSEKAVYRDVVYQAKPKARGYTRAKIDAKYRRPLAIAIFDKGMAQMSLRQLQEHDVVTDRTSREAKRLFSDLHGVGWFKDGVITPQGYYSLFHDLPPALQTKYEYKLGATPPPPPTTTPKGRNGVTS